MEYGAHPVPEEDDEQDKYKGYAGVDQEGCRGDAGFFFAVVGTADVTDMGIFEQAGFRLLENRCDDEKKGPGTVLRFGQCTNKDHVVDEGEKSDRKPLQDRIEGGPDPVRRG